MLLSDGKETLPNKTKTKQVTKNNKLQNTSYKNKRLQYGVFD
jgi:hypothetical protein